MYQDFFNVLTSIRHDSNSFDKINNIAVDKLRIQNKGSFKIEANFHLSIFIIKGSEIYLAIRNFCQKC